jgi:outer membrane receptor for ferrienterochelin and colicins
LITIPVLVIKHTDNSVNAKQTTNTTGVFAQYELGVQKLKITAGGRVDYYTVKDLTFSNEELSQFVFIPRLSLLYDFNGYTRRHG